MDSTMVYIPIECEVRIQYPDLKYGLDFQVDAVNTNCPRYVWSWVEKQIYDTFELSDQEEREKPASVFRRIEFEVEVVPNMKGGIYDAICHTVCPQFVKEWAQAEVMKMPVTDTIELR